MLVLPVPVSPVRRTGSECEMALASRAMSDIAGRCIANGRTAAGAISIFAPRADNRVCPARTAMIRPFTSFSVSNSGVRVCRM